MPTYRGHRSNSFTAIDEAELTELRARQRTYDGYGTYLRTALGTLSYALVVLKLFDRRFYRIGLLYVVLASLLLILSLVRNRHSNLDFSDMYRPPENLSNAGKRVFGRPFVTAGKIVIIVSGIVAIVEIVLLVLILRL